MATPAPASSSPSSHDPRPELRALLEHRDELLHQVRVLAAQRDRERQRAAMAERRADLLEASLRRLART